MSVQLNTNGSSCIPDRVARPEVSFGGNTGKSRDTLESCKRNRCE